MPPEVAPAIPGLDFGSDQSQLTDKPVPRKKVPYAKPIPRSFEQAWESGAQPAVIQGEEHGAPQQPGMNELEGMGVGGGGKQPAGEEH